MSAALWFLAGLAGGTAHFLLLRWNTRLYIAEAGLARAFSWQLLRLAATAILLGIAAWHGALPLLLTALGIMIARPVVLRATAVTP